MTANHADAKAEGAGELAGLYVAEVRALAAAVRETAANAGERETEETENREIETMFRKQQRVLDQNIERIKRLCELIKRTGEWAGDLAGCSPKVEAEVREHIGKAADTGHRELVEAEENYDTAVKKFTFVSELFKKAKPVRDVVEDDGAWNNYIGG